MTHRLATNYAKNYCNRTLIDKVIVENVVTCFGGHSAEPNMKWIGRPVGGCGHMAIWNFFQDGVGRRLGFVRTENSAIRSAVPENPTLEPNMECIGSHVVETWPFAYLVAYGTPSLGEGEVVGGQRWRSNLDAVH